MTFAEIRFAVQAAVCLPLVCWAIRRTDPIDEELEHGAVRLRWSIVAIGLLSSVAVTGDQLAVVRASAFLIATGFLAWPNLAGSLWRMIRG